MFLYCYLGSKGNGNCFGRFTTRRNAIFLILFLMFLLACGEEISWGQRFFHWRSSGIFERNLQQETNIHNLDLFTSGFSVYRLFVLFWISYCIVFPLLLRFSYRAGRFSATINIPAPPYGSERCSQQVWFSENSLMRRAFLHSALVLSKFQELVETNYAFAFFVLGVFWIATREFQAKSLSSFRDQVSAQSR